MQVYKEIISKYFGCHNPQGFFSQIVFDIMKQGGNPVNLAMEFKHANEYIFWHKCG